MSNDTTTEETVVEQPQDGQAEETIEVSAESLRSDSSDDTQEPTEVDNSEETQEDEEESVPTDDTDLKEWARKKGVDPDDPEAILKLARDTEKGFRQYSEKAKAETNELKKQVTQSSEFGDSESVIQEARVINFYNSNPEARDYDKQMGEIYARFQQSDPDFAGHLVRHLDTLYAMAKAEDNSAKVQQARQEGKVEATQAIKKAQTASTPRVNASSSAPAESGWTKERVAKVIQEGKYNEYREEIKAWERTLYQ
jgi:hypothetical protein